jgi:predicted flavoprotein YhiN
MHWHKNSWVAFAVMLLSLASGHAGSASVAERKDFDVVVVSGSSGGLGAALAAGRLGAHVALLEDTPVLGGMLSSGISNIDSFSYESLSGIFEEFRLRVKDFYARNDPADPLFQEKSFPATSLDGRSQQSNNSQQGGRWEPHVAAQIFRDMMAACPNVEVFYNQTPIGVVMRGNRILGVTTHGK